MSAFHWPEPLNSRRRLRRRGLNRDQDCNLEELVWGQDEHQVAALNIVDRVCPYT